jgi:hypothetical protein
LTVSEEIPPVSSDVEEDRDPTIGLGTRLANESNAGLRHPSVRGVEVIGAKKEPDSAGCLITDGCTLAFSVCTGEKKTRLCAGRADDHPALGSSVVGERWRVLDEVEPEYAGEKRNGRVILVDDQGNQVDLHPGSVRAAR